MSQWRAVIHLRRTSHTNFQGVTHQPSQTTNLTLIFSFLFFFFSLFLRFSLPDVATDKLSLSFISSLSRSFARRRADFLDFTSTATYPSSSFQIFFAHWNFHFPESNTLVALRFSRKVMGQSLPDLNSCIIPALRCSSPFQSVLAVL